MLLLAGTTAGFEFSKVHQQGIPGVGLAELASPVSLSDRLQHWFHKRWYHWARGAWRRAFDRSRRRSNAELHQCTDQLHQKKG